MRSFRFHALALLAAAFALLPLASAEAGEFPDNWYFYNGGDTVKAKRLRALEGKKPPALNVANWTGGEAVKIADLEGKVVVVDFWGTWCGPCMRAVPKNIKLVEEFKDKGLEFIGVHSTNRAATMAAAHERTGMNYRVASDVARTTARDFRVGWWPTYIVIDKAGNIRAAGLFPERVRNVVEKLLEETVDVAQLKADEAAANPVVISEADEEKERQERAATHVVQASWLEGNAQRRAALAKLDASSPPALPTADWMNSEMLSLEDLKGKVVVVDFWATWCAPCKRAVPKLKALQAKYGSHGLVVIGVCAERGAENLQATVEQHEIDYPVCVDADSRMARACQVDGFPDYYVIDRAGTLRIADCRSDAIEQAVRMLISEPAE